MQETSGASSFWPNFETHSNLYDVHTRNFLIKIRETPTSFDKFSVYLYTRQISRFANLSIILISNIFRQTIKILSKYCIDFLQLHYAEIIFFFNIIIESTIAIVVGIPKPHLSGRLIGNLIVVVLVCNMVRLLFEKQL